jgi:hypothetical protein
MSSDSPAMTRKLTLIFFLLIAFFLAGCESLPNAPAMVQRASTVTVPKSVASPHPTRVLPTSTKSPVPSPWPTATPTPSPTALTATDQPSELGCVEPPDDYTRVKINGYTINQRTLWMLQRAQEIYGGPGDLLRVVQGSYTDVLTESFGTHAGGGAVDISIRDPRQLSTVLWDETDKMVAALRQVGFAAWYRAPGDLGQGSSAHIHAIAVGDRELSTAAQEQLTGPSGYFRGLDGLPPPWGPNPDRHGGPVICGWMITAGYRDLR